MELDACVRARRGGRSRRARAGVMRPALALFAAGTALVCAPAAAHAQTLRACTEAGLNAAIAAGGWSTFNCAAPTTIALTSAKTIAASGTILDGGNRVTFQGQAGVTSF